MKLSAGTFSIELCSGQLVDAILEGFGFFEWVAWDSAFVSVGPDNLSQTGSECVGLRLPLTLQA